MNLLEVPSPKYLKISLIVLILLTILSYLPIKDNDFVNWDDPKYLTENNYVKNFKLPELFTKPTVGNFHPLTMLSLATEYWIFGPKAQAFHFISLLLHLINTVLVIFLIWKLFPLNYYIALLTGALFALHPQHVESVAWLAERKDVLSTLFFLLSLLSYLKYLKLREVKLELPYWRLRQYWYCLGLFLLALFSKPMVVTLPFILLLLDYKTLRKFSRSILTEKILFFLLSLVFGIINLNMQVHGFLIKEKVYNIFEIFLAFINSMAFYLFKSLIPIKLSVIYQKNAVSISILEYLISSLILTLIIISIIYFKKYRRALIFGFLFFFISILPVSGIFPFSREQLFADRYFYIPSIGLFFTYLLIFHALLGLSTKYQNGLKYLFSVSLVLYIAYYSIFSYKRTATWKNTETLFNDVIKKYPNTSAAHFNLAKHLSDRGLIKESIDSYLRCIKIDPRHAVAHYNLGNMYYRLKQMKNAISKFKDALNINPLYIEAMTNMGVAYLKMKEYENAMAALKKALLIDPTNIVALHNLGICYAIKKQYKLAIEMFEKIISIDPNDSLVHYQLSLLYKDIGKPNKAKAELYKHLKINPNSELSIDFKTYKIND